MLHFNLGSGSVFVHCVCILQCIGFFSAACSDAKLIQGHCGEILTNIDVEEENSLVSFKSPHYPNFSSGELNCELKLLLPHDDEIAIRLEFIEFEMDGEKYGGYQSKECDADMFFIKGFHGWTPPARCGNLTGYATLIDRQDPRASDMKIFTLLALMSSTKYKWNIQISLLKHNDTKLEALDSSSSEIISSTTESESSTMSPDQAKEEFNSGKPQNLTSKSIYHGKNTSIDQVPWQVSIRRTYKSMEELYGTEFTQSYFESTSCDFHEHLHFCGGSIIHPKYILTAAHCFFGQYKTQRSKSPSDIVVVIGDTAKCDSDADSKSYEVEQIIFQYAYDRATMADDIVLLKLKTEINMDETTAKIVGLATEENSFYEGRNATGSGWGLNAKSNTSTPNILQSSDQFLIRNGSDCVHCLTLQLGAYPETFTKHPKYSQLTRSVICTGEAEWDHQKSNETKIDQVAHTGKGDSGGPLVVYDEKTLEPIQIGITSFAMWVSSTNGNAAMDYFTSVSFYRQWISLVIDG